MTRDDYEALLWRTLSRYAPRPRPADVAALLTAAHDYALTEYGITADRRAALAATPSRRLHYIPFDGDDGDEFACHPTGNATGTTAAGEVTCRQCLRTDAYKNDLALSRESA